MWNGFFNLNHLSEDKLKEFLRDAKNLSYDNNIQKITNRTREITNDFSVDDYINNIVKTNHHNVCIDRFTYHPIEDNKHGEIGSSTYINNTDYLLYIYVTPENLYNLVDKYNLTKKEL